MNFRLCFYGTSSLKSWFIIFIYFLFRSFYYFLCIYACTIVCSMFTLSLHFIPLHDLLYWCLFVLSSFYHKTTGVVSAGTREKYFSYMVWASIFFMCGLVCAWFCFCWYLFSMSLSILNTFYCKSLSICQLDWKWVSLANLEQVILCFLCGKKVWTGLWLMRDVIWILFFLFTAAFLIRFSWSN